MSHAVGVMNGNFRAGDYYRYRLEVEAAGRAEAEKAAKTRELKQIHDVCMAIRDMMDSQEEYDEWWEASPEKDFLGFASDCLIKMMDADRQGDEPNPYFYAGELYFLAQFNSHISTQEIPF